MTIYRLLKAGRLEEARAIYRWFAPLLATIVTALLLVVPVFLALIEIGREVQAILNWMEHARQGGVQMPSWLPKLPLAGSQIAQWWRMHLSDPQGFANLFGDIDSESITGWIRHLGGQFVYRIILALLTFVTIFVLLRHGAEFGGRVLALAEQWLGQPGERLFEKMLVAVRGAVNGTVIIAIAEGLLIGLGYALAGVPHAILFAILTAAFAMLPLGAWFAFSAAALVLVLSDGSVPAAAGVFAWGAVVMVIGDNVVQPALIAGAARLPLLWTLIGILGGLETFGIVGIFLGPVIMAALLTIWRDWLDRPLAMASTGH